MSKFTTIAATTLLALSLGTAGAMASGADMFDNQDGNKDGVISMSEAQGLYPTLNSGIFNLADADHNGVLDESEFYGLRGLTAGF